MAIFTVRRELLVFAWLTIAAAIIGPALLAWSVIYTSGGLQFVVRHLPHRFAGVQLDIVGVSGTVARGLAVERVEIDHELVHLKFEGIEGRVALRPLLLQTIRVRHGSVASALIGLLLLIATPVGRVVLSLVAFAIQRDRVYVTITVIVLAVLAYSLAVPHGV